MSAFRRIANLFTRRRVERENESELGSHIAMRIEDNIANGMSSSEARRDALVRFGNPTVMRERTSEADVALYFESVWADVRFALRQLRKSPAFAVSAILALSLGVGATSAIFSVIDAIVLRPLPFAHQERLIFPFMKGRNGGSLPSSVLSYYDERAQLQTFDALAGYSVLDRINLERPAGAVSLPAVKTTDNFFQVFGVAPMLGRTFLPGEDQPGKDFVAVLSYEVWKDNFDGREDIVGKPVRLDGAPYTIIGVMPAGFRYPLSSRQSIYTPLHAPDGWRKARGMHWMRTVGLLKPGVSREQAQADVDRVMANLARSYPEQEAGHTVALMPLAEAVNGFGFDNKTKGPIETLTLAVMALLGIGCVNVAGLLLARGVKREREIALRAAVGANRSRLIRQMVNESLVLSFAGLAGGLLMSWALLKAMNIFLVQSMARGAEVELNGKVVAVALGVSMITSVLASLAPAIRLSGTDPNRALRNGSGAGMGIGQHRLRSSFVITQVALSMVLLVVSGLLLEHLQSLLKTNLGFEAKKIVSVRIALSRGRYESTDPLTGFYKPLLERVAHLPGVQGAGVIDLLPILEWGDGYNVHITGQAPYPKDASMGAETRNVSEGYFNAMGIRRLDGRLLNPSFDRPENAASNMVVNAAFQRKFLASGGSLVGAHIDDDPKAELKSGIVGEVSDIRQDLQQPAMPEMDWLIDAIPPKGRLDALKSMFLMVRTDGDPQALIPSIRQAILAIDPTVPFREAVTMDQVVNDNLIFERMESWLFGIFAGFALLLAVIGLYGLISHEVQLRTRELGIRMALGSSRRSVVAQIMRRMALLMLGGIATGWILTFAFRRVLASFVDLHAASDMALILAISVGIGLIGILTSIAPATSAASIDPMEALRAD